MGVGLGVDAIGHCYAIASLVFAGPLVGGLQTGTVVFLASTIAVTLALSRWGGLPGAFGIAQDSSIAIVAVAAATAAAAVAAKGEDPVPTGLMIVGLSAVLSGLAFFAMGRLGLGRIVRVLPYPVALGFLASSGWLLAHAALSMVTSGEGPVGMVTGLFDHASVALPAIIMGISLIAALKIWAGGGVIMAVIGAFLAGFYVFLYATGHTVSEAQDLGWLPAADEIGPLVRINAHFFQVIDWAEIMQVAPSFAVIVIINIIAFSLNNTGAELEARSDLDLDRELRSAGLANAAVGLFGGVTGFISTGAYIMAHKLGLLGRGLTVAYLAVVLAGVFLAVKIVAITPVFLVGGLLLFMGAAVLEDFLIAPMRRLSWFDRMTVITVVAITAWQGLFTAVAVGLVLALLTFVMTYAHVSVVRGELSRRPRRSNIDRSPAEEIILREGWRRVRLAQLQGYLFFGSIDRLIDNIFDRLALDTDERTAARPVWLIIDFSSVTGIDTSVCSALEKLGYMANIRHLKVHLCGAPPDVMDVMHRWDGDFVTTIGFVEHGNLEGALETIEASLLAERPETAAMGNGLELLLDAMGEAHPRLPELARYFENVALDDGEVLINKGSDTRDIFVVESGRVAVRLNLGGGTFARVRTFTAGSMVGEIASYLNSPRTADVVSVGASKVQRLPEHALVSIERNDRDLAALLHRIVARGLAEKVIRTNQLLTDG